MELHDGELEGTERFQVIARIGAGGMGAVYKAFDREQGAHVALKTLLRVDATELVRFKAEFRALADLRHPNWVRFGELFEVDGRWFFSMELVEGTDFLSHVRGRRTAAAFEETMAAPAVLAHTVPVASAGPLDPAGGAPPCDERRLRAALLELARGLHALHAIGKVHRDVKPSNLMVTPTGRVVILDFGLVTDARARRRDAEKHVAGTLAYMAPEQALPRPVGPEADWYAVGVMMYEALSGDVPHLGCSADVLAAKQRDVPRPPRTPGEHADLDALCMDLLRADPAERPRGEEILRRLAGDAAPEIAAPRIAGAEQGGLFVGRERDLDALREALAASRRGRAVSVLVTGESGLGKSALARRFTDRLSDEQPSAVVLHGRCYEGEWVPFKALDGVVDALSDRLAAASREAATPLLPDDVGLLANTFLALRRVEAIAEAPAPGRGSIEPFARRVRVFAALRELFARIAARAPLVVVIDDMQWADADSLALLRDLLREPAAPALCLVLTLRTPGGEAPPALHDLLGAPPGAIGDARRIALDPLSSDQAHALAVELLGDAASAADLAAESGGHPLFLQELVRHGIHAAGAPGAPARIRLDEALWERARRLDPAALRLLQIVALAGGRITQDVATAASELTPASFAQHASALRAASLAQTTGRRGSDAIEPYHDRVREVVAARIDADARRALHRRLALAIEAGLGDDHEMLPLHWQGAGEPRKAAEHAIRAARRAEEAFAFDRAARLYQLALEVGDHGPAATADLQEKLGDCLANAGRGTRAAGAYLAAASADPRRALDARRRAAEQLLRSGLVDEGVEQLGAVLAAVGMRLPATPARALVSLLARRARVRLRGIGFRSRSRDEIPSDALLRVDVCLSTGTALGLIDNIRAADFQARGLLLALDAGEPLRIARALAVEACFAAAEGRPGKARAGALLRASRALAEAAGDPFVLGWCLLAEGMVAYCVGEFAESHEKSRRARETFTERCPGVAWERETADLYTNISACYLGRLGELGEAVERGRRDADERGDLFASLYVRSGLPLMSRLARDEPDAARREVEDTLRRWSHRGYLLAHYWCFLAAVHIDLYQGDARAAHDRVHAEWAALDRSLLLRTVQIIRVESLHLRARAALALAGPEGSAGPDRGRLLRAAANDAAALAREKTAYATPLAALVRAGVAAARGDLTRAVEELAAAIAGFEAADMKVHAAVARLRRGALAGDDAEVSAAEGSMRAAGVVAPLRFTAMLAPGFPSGTLLVGPTGCATR